MTENFNYATYKCVDYGLCYRTIPTTEETKIEEPAENDEKPKTNDGDNNGKEFNNSSQNQNSDNEKKNNAKKPSEQQGNCYWYISTNMFSF